MGRRGLRAAGPTLLCALARLGGAGDNQQPVLLNRIFQLLSGLHGGEDVADGCRRELHVDRRLSVHARGGERIVIQRDHDAAHSRDQGRE